MIFTEKVNAEAVLAAPPGCFPLARPRGVCY